MRHRIHEVKYRRTFPTFAVVILIFAGLWLLRELEVIDLSLPFLPVVLIVVSIGVIFNRLIG